MTLCCNKAQTGAIDWNPYNQVVQCHACGHVYLPKNYEEKGISINELCSEAFKIATSKGWHEKEPETGTMLALIHSEVSEALEADRKGDEGNFVEELADVCIRVFDLCGSRKIDLEKAITDKMEKNKSRSYKHGNKKY